MKSYWSLSSGLTYSYSSYNTRLDVGASAYHLNNPQQTFLKDPYQVVPDRYVAYVFFDKQLDNERVLNTLLLFQQQASLTYAVAGISYGIPLSSNNQFLNLGVLYRYQDAIIPHLSLTIGNKQLGFSYDATWSKLNAAAVTPHGFELSFSWRSMYPERDKMKCPYSPFR